MQDQIDSILKGDFTSESDRSYCIQPLGDLKFPLGEFLWNNVSKKWEVAKLKLLQPKKTELTNKENQVALLGWKL